VRLLVLAALLAAPSAQAQMYKCVDARGVTAYSDKPCPDGKGREVDIRGQPPISGKLDSYGGNVNDAERDFRKRQQQREREEQKEAAADAARGKRCAQLRAEHQRWLSVGRVAVVDSKGERRYLDDSERSAKIAQLDAAIARDCR
jgi:Domain of unknown function (DUF4124)